MLNTNKKISYNGIDVSFETITPEIAQQYIDESEIKFSTMEGMKQRRVRQGTVNLYSKDMTNGKWEINGDTIRFDKEGRLMDGGHRLRSIIKSGIPQVCLVVRGIDNSVMHTIDAGLKRSLENYLQFQENSYINGSAAIVKIKLMLDNMKTTVDQSNANIGLSNIDYVEEYMRNDDLYKEAVYLAKGINKAIKTMRIPEVGGIYLHLTKTKGFDKDIVINFFFRLTSVGRSENTIYSRTLDNLDKIKQGKDRIYEYMKCWNAFVKGTKNLATIDENSWFLTPKPYMTYKEIA